MTAMASIPVFNADGQQTGQMEIDPAWLGGKVRPKLLKQAVVVHLDRTRQYSARTRSRSMVKGSTRKLYRQKGTGRARMGTIRTNIRRGGGVAFAKLAGARRLELPRKMRALAGRNAVLAKVEAADAAIVEGFVLDAPRTKAMARMLAAVGAESGCVFTTDELDRNVYLSGRNIPKADVRTVRDLNAYDILRRKKLIFTRPAFEAYCRMVSGRGGN
ncbi:MAG: 50S ribosomal protein L4 [Phycisphaerales bacterium]|nr:MAG: 50S ribosomal protein L4 [Phycisphaerales bacterium]